MNGQNVIQHIQSLGDNDLNLLAEFADRAIFAEELETSLKFPRQRYEPMDVVLVVIEKMLKEDKGKNFDPTKGTIVNWIKGSIVFEIKNMIRLRSSQSEVTNVDEEREHQHISRWAKKPSNPETAFTNEEMAGEVWIALHRIVEDDSELVELVHVLENGIDLKKSQVLAEELGWTVQKVNNAKKRFFRRLRKSEDEFRSLM